ncbi:MAG: polysaccharide biosynthesis tyrosine autokinase [Solirubrobacterales bacterium]
MELRELLAILWKRRLLVAFVVLATAALSAAFAFTRPPRYESASTLALTPNNQNAGFITPDTLNALVGTYAQTAQSSLILDQAEERIGGPLPGSVDTSTQAGTGILEIIGEADTPEDAARIASTVSGAFIEYLDSAETKLFAPQIVDPAIPPDSESQPGPALIVAIGILLGLLAGAMLAYLVEQFRRRIETSTDIAELTPLPIIGSLPYQRRLSRNASKLVWDDLELTSLQEAVRALRTNVEVLVENQRSILLVTSPLAKEGKSTIVANLGVALSQVGIKTLIVDADLRRPAQHEIFNVSNGTGLSSALTGKVDAKLRQAATGYPGLSLLPSGPVPPDSTELLHVRSTSLIEELRKTDSLVLIDSPPILPLSDARILAGKADGVLMAVAAGVENPSTLRHALETLQFGSASILGIVLNRAAEHFGGARHYYDRVREPKQPDIPASERTPVTR